MGERTRYFTEPVRAADRLIQDRDPDHGGCVIYAGVLAVFASGALCGVAYTGEGVMSEAIRTATRNFIGILRDVDINSIPPEILETVVGSANAFITTMTS